MEVVKDAAQGFDPAPYLRKINGGQDYLDVKWRILWFRRDHPNGSITTDLVSHDLDERLAIFRAVAVLPDGGMASGFGSETATDFRDYIEKAETKAIGRALAALGYGTQFATDHEMGEHPDGSPNLADSPIDLARTRARRAPGGEGTPATARQIKYLYAIAREAGMSDDELDREAQELYGHDAAELARRDASAFIERLQQRREAYGESGEAAPSRPATAPARLDQRWIERLDALTNDYLQAGGVADDYLSLVRQLTGGSPEFARLTKPQATDLAKQIEAMTAARTTGDLAR